MAVCLLIGGACLCSTEAATGSNVDQAKSRIQPWSGYWWPLREARMLQPLAKYDLITGRQAAAWEQEQHAVTASTPGWHGYCHAQSASAVLEREPTSPRTIVVSGSQSVSLSIGDQKGLLAACHAQDIANTYGDRFGDGDGSEDRQDLSPDELWRLLQIYVKQQQIPLILDIESGEEVWNYPVFAYRVDQVKVENGWRRGRMELWMADNGVAPDYVGVKVRRHVYHFQFRTHRTSVIAGSAKWIGTSKQDHPDFAWYPFLARAENPEVDVAIVRRLVHSGQASLTNVASPDDRTTVDDVSSQSGNVEHAESDSQVLARRQTESASADQVSPREQATILSPLELASAVTSQRSDFALDVTVDRFDGGSYKIGDSLSVRVSSGKAGWLYLFRIAPTGELTLIFPLADDDHRVRANGSTTLPYRGAGYKYAAPGPVGVHRIKAIVTSKPLEFTGLERIVHDDSAPHRSAREFRWHPTQRAQIQNLLRTYTKSADKQQTVRHASPSFVGEFAQDEVVFLVAPAEQRKR
jgi:hypothetical protein